MTEPEVVGDQRQSEFEAIVLALREKVTEDRFQRLRDFYYTYPFMQNDTADLVRSVVSVMLLDTWSLILCADMPLDYVWNFIDENIGSVYAMLTLGEVKIVSEDAEPCTLGMLRHFLSVLGGNKSKVDLERERADQNRGEELKALIAHYIQTGDSGLTN